MDKSKKKMLIVYAAGMTIIPVALSFVFDDLVLINFCVYLLLVYYTFKFFKTDIKDNLKQINKKMFLPYFLAGLFLGYVYYKEKNFIVSFGIHSIYNLLCLILFG